MGISGSKKNEEKNRVNENICIGSEIKEIDICLNQICKSICKIKIKSPYNYKVGTGFLLKFHIEEKLFFYLMTNFHFISEDIILSKKEIEIYYNFENEKRNIKLNQYERLIEWYKYLDITMIKILKVDNINENYFLLPYLDYNNIKDKKIYIPQYQEGSNIYNSESEILKINRYEITYNASIKNRALGSPIFLKNSTRVIGIHKQGNKTENENYGSFIYPIINRYNNKIIYFKDKYEGEFVNGKFEGKGKYIYEDNGEYYIGEWKNNLQHGRGIMYYKNGDIKYIY